jgi:sugar lactone lactonase YvrE
MRGLFAFALVLAGLAGLAAPPAGAHQLPGTVDLGPMTTYVQDQVAVTAAGDRKIHAAYVRIGRALAKGSVLGFADDLRKLAVVAKELAGPLAAESGLGTLFSGLMEDARTVIDRYPSSIEEAIDAVHDSGRPKLERIAVSARAQALAGRSAALSSRARLALWIRAALGYRRTDQLADKAAIRQGGPVPNTFAAQPGKIYTVAGRGSGGYNGDGLLARRSFLYWVEKIKFGPDGKLYILDWNNHMLRRLESDGTLTRICGQGVPGDSEGDPFLTQLNHPSAIDFDTQGRIYIAAWHNHKVKVYDPYSPSPSGPSPTVYTIAGTIQGNSGDGLPATQAKFNLLPGVLMLPASHPLGGGDLLCTDAANQCVRVVKLGTDPKTDVNVAGVTVKTGTVNRVFGTGVQGHAGDNTPASGATVGFSKAQNAESDGRMSIDAAGNIFLVCGVEGCIRKITTDGIIHTVAGNGTQGFSGDNGPATSAQLNFPSDVAVAPDGTLYISDQNNQVVRKVDPAGVITTVVGVPGVPGYDGEAGSPAAAHLHRPTGLELDAEGNLWMCDKDNSVIRVVTAASTTLQVPRQPYTLPVAALGKPPSKGPSGTIDTFAGTGFSAYTGDGRPALETDLYWPQDVSIQPSTGLVYIDDWNNHKIRRIEDDGTVKTVVGGGELGDTDGDALGVRMNHPTDIAFGPLDGDLYIASWHTDKIKHLVGSTNQIVTVNKVGGKRAFSGDAGPVSNAELNLPAGVTFDSTGNMYIGDEGNRRVRKVNQSDQQINTILGTGVPGFSGDTGQGVSAQIDLPVGQSAQPAGKVCIDPTDQYLYLADTNNNRVRRLDLVSGVVTTVAGNGVATFAGDGGQATSASLSFPVDVDCDATGNLYICDRDNHCVRKVTLATGVITTVAGIGGVSGYEGDKGPATQSRLNIPGGIHVDRSTGRLYIADTFNSVIRVVWE